jgi:CTP:molybdopterin cytidylyltransferase MocA
VARHDGALHGELDRRKHPKEHRIDNSEADRGMFTSIRLAAGWVGWVPSLTHWAVVLGDQPHLALATLSALIEAAMKCNHICQPAYRGHAHHPVILPRNDFLALSTTPHQTLKEVLLSRASSVRLVEVADPAVEFDIDTPEDYRGVFERFGGWEQHGGEAEGHVR